MPRKGLIPINPMLMILLVLALIANLVSFCLMGYDKRCARKGAWRVKESTLFIACACFGGIGGVLGMNLFRHKTKHWTFKLFFPLMMVAQIALLILAAVWLM